MGWASAHGGTWIGVCKYYKRDNWVVHVGAYALNNLRLGLELGLGLGGCHETPHWPEI